MPAALPALVAAFIVAACGHALYNGSRMVNAMMAIELGAGPALLGLFTALGGVLPTLFGIQIGRMVDRVGVRVPVAGALALAFTGFLTPFLWPSYSALALSSLLGGLAFMTGIIGANNAVAKLTRPDRRAGQLGWLSATSSIGGAIALVLLGFAVDHFGTRSTFALVALIPALSLVLLGLLGRGLPKPAADAPAHPGGSTLDIWRDPALRRMLLLSAVVPVANDTFSFLMPILASNNGWSASVTGVVMGSAVGAALASRLVLPWATRHMESWTLLCVSFVAITAGYLMIPLITSPVLMAGISLVIGIGTGVAPPVLSALLFGASPPGRQGEVFGLRGSLQFALAAGVPLAVGTLGSFVGLAPMILAMGLGMGIAARTSFKERARDKH